MLERSIPTETQSFINAVRVWSLHLIVCNSRSISNLYACYECFYPLGSYPLLRGKAILPNLRKRKTLQSSKKITTLSKSCSVLSRTFLFALFFDFGNLFCRCGHNPYARIAHTVKERVKLPPLRVLLWRRFQKELVYGNIVAEHQSLFKIF